MKKRIFFLFFVSALAMGVLAAAEPVLGSADDPEQALAAELPALEHAAAEMLRDLGRDEPVSVTLQNERFPTRDYETFSLPAGVYRTLRVTIGAGEGHNWWCVMYPPICLPAAEEKQELSDVLDDGQLQIVENEPQYEIKFKFVEIYESIAQFFAGEK